MAKNKIIDVTLRLKDQMTGKLGAATSKLADSSKQWERYGKQVQRTGKKITNVGSTMTKRLTVPIVGAGAAALKVAADFEEGMDKVAAISGATGGEIKKLSKKAEEMGAKTKFSATEASEAFSYMAMAGWKTKDMLSGIDGIMYLAGASGEDLATTSDIVTDAMTAFGMSASGTSTVLKDGVKKEVSNTTRFVDVLAAASNNANTNVSMMGESFKYVSSVAGSMGYSIEDTATALGLMANAGIKSSQGGTALRGLLTNMAKQPKEAEAAMSALGLSLDDGHGKMKSLKQIMDDLRGAFGKIKMPQAEFTKQMTKMDTALKNGKMTQKQYDKATEDLTKRAYGAEGAEKARYAAMLAGKTGMAGLLAIVGAAPKDYDKLTDAINNSNGAANKMYKTATDNLKGKITELKSKTEALGISFGRIIAPYALKAVKALQKLIDKFDKLPKKQKETIVKIAAIVAVAGPMLMIFGKMVTTVGSAISTFGKFGKAIKGGKSLLGALAMPGGKVVLIIAAVVAAIVAAVLIGKKYKKQIKAFFEKIKEMFGSFKKKVIEVKNSITGFFKAFGKSKTAKSFIKPIQKQLKNLKKNFAELKEALQPLKKAITKFFGKVGDVAKEMYNVVSPVFKAYQKIVRKALAVVVGAAVDTAVKKIKLFLKTASTIISSILKVFNGLIKFLTGVFTGNWKKCWQGLKDIVSGIFSGLKAIVTAPINGIISTFNGVIGGVNKLADKLPQKLKKGLSFLPIPEIPQLYKGTSNWQGGLTSVNERGGEIIDLPRGSRVYPHDESVRKAYSEGAKSNKGGRSTSIKIAKLADQIVVREEADIDKIAQKLADKLEKVSQNLSAEEIGYVY